MQLKNSTKLTKEAPPPLRPLVSFNLPEDPIATETVTPEMEEEEEEDRTDVTPSHYRTDRNGFFARYSKRVARHAWTYLIASFIVTLIFSVVAMVVGDFKIEADSIGYATRGTLIGDRETQFLLFRANEEALLQDDNEAVWEDLTTHLQPSWETQSDGMWSSAVLDDDLFADSENRWRGRRGLSSSTTRSGSVVVAKDERGLPFYMPDDMMRHLERNSLLEGCDADWYKASRFKFYSRLWPIWKTTKEDLSILSPRVLYDLCVAEENTQRVLEDHELCFGCDKGCLPPYSVVLYARLKVDNGTGLTYSCEELREAWKPYQASTEAEWQSCVQDIKASVFDPGAMGSLPESCPFSFDPGFVNEDFDETLVLSSTSSIFATYRSKIEETYRQIDKFDHGSDTIRGTYDTQWSDYNYLYQDEAIAKDMGLAMGSAIVVVIAIMVHTRSPLVTIVGLCQIMLSFPTAFFFYSLVGGLSYFPFLGFIGIFIVFALGADDVFVAVDKWRNARLHFPDVSTESIATLALPDAAAAMFLTTLTTSLAFFATAICQIAPVKLFAIFCGLLVALDYVLCVLLVFPTLCIRDKAIQAHGKKVNCCISINFSGCAMGSRRRIGEDRGAESTKAQALHVMEANEVARNTKLSDTDENQPAEREGQQSVIHCILSFHYCTLHRFRWIILAICISALGVSTYFASNLGLPPTLDVRVLPNSCEYEQNYEWRQQLLSYTLENSAGSDSYVIWGLDAADTGDHKNPLSFSKMVLDESFDLSSAESQLYMMGFCDDLFANDFAVVLDSADYTCPMVRFNQWLADQQNKSTKSQQYLEHCRGAAEVPVPEADFHPCFASWARQTNETRVFVRDEQVKILVVPFRTRVSYTSGFEDLRDEFRLIENWMQDKIQGEAPTGLDTGYFIGRDFWWYDSHRAMQDTAYGSVAIALGASSLVILFASRSLVLTLFATGTIFYVLASVTAILVALGWTLGFLESVCFAILIGVSADYVTHFSHAYTHLVGDIRRGVRTKHALIHMGPSILAAGFTTAASAVIMLFTIVLFFERFAYVLLFSVVQATVGAFVFFCVLTDCLGPANPTFYFDKATQFFQFTRSNREDEISAKSFEEPKSEFGV